MSDDEVPFDCTPAEVSAEGITREQVPTRSSCVYEASFRRFTTWCSEKEVSEYSEDVLLTYFLNMAKSMRSSSLWSHYSMIKSLLKIRHNVDISKYLKLRTFLKNQSVGYSPEKTKVFTKEEFDKFFIEAPDEKYLAIKVNFHSFQLLIIEL